MVAQAKTVAPTVVNGIKCPLLSIATDCDG